MSAFGTGFSGGLFQPEAAWKDAYTTEQTRKRKNGSTLEQIPLGQEIDQAYKDHKASLSNLFGIYNQFGEVEARSMDLDAARLDKATAANGAPNDLRNASLARRSSLLSQVIARRNRVTLLGANQNEDSLGGAPPEINAGRKSLLGL